MTIIIQTGDYALHATVTPLSRPAGQFHLKFTTQLNTSKNTTDQRTVFEFTGDRVSLRALVDTVSSSIG